MRKFLILLLFALFPLSWNAESVDEWKESLRAGNVSEVDRLIGQGLDINGPIQESFLLFSNFIRITPLTFAAMNNRYEVCTLLLEKGADVNFVYPTGWSALNMAAYLADARLIELLIWHGANVCWKESIYGFTPLVSVFCNSRLNDRQRLELVKLLIVHGASVNSREYSFGYTPLMVAVLLGVKGDITDSPFLDPPSIPNNFLKTIIKLLIDAGADINLESINDLTALDYAARTCNPEIIDILLAAGAKNGAEIEDINGKLLQAVRAGDAVEIKRLIDNKADIETRDIRGRSLLAIAAASGNAEVIKFLIESGANVNSCNEQGLTPLMEAVIKGHTVILQCLINAGADVNATVPFYNYTALMFIPGKNVKEIYSILIDAGADPAITNIYGDGPSFPGQGNIENWRL
jgi:ankyrin repeat protein